MSKEVLTLDSLDANKLPELQGLKENQIKLVEENPYIEIVDNKTYEEAKKRRTALLKGRTSLESSEKLIASKLSNFRKQVGSATKELIDITLPHEEKQQEEVKRYEQIKENERLERERLENERIEKIKSKISELETKSYETINSWGVDVLQNSDNSVFTGMDTDFDFEEFDILYQQAKARVQEYCETKINSLQEKENQRIENERLAREKAEADAKLKAIEEQQAKEKKEREEKELEQKTKQFEVRKNRLLEIGLEFNGLDFSIDYKKTGLFSPFELLGADVLECDVIDFENLLIEIKNKIQEAKDKAEKEKSDKEAADKLEKENKLKADKENKARVKRLAQDKAIYKQILSETLGRFPIVFDANQKEIKDFSIETSNRVTDLYNELLTELENL